MPLAVRTTTEDILKICQYLSTKPTGVTITEAKRVLDISLLNNRKLSALKTWNLIEDADGRLKVTDDGRLAIKDIDKGMPKVLRSIIRRIEPYNAAIERAAHTNEQSLSAIDVASYWHNHFAEEVANSDEVLNDQAVCFFQLVHGARLGELIVGRKGSPTRVDFFSEALNSFVRSVEPPTENNRENIVATEHYDDNEQDLESNDAQHTNQNVSLSQGVGRVFITHGRNTKIVEQLKQIVIFGKLTPIVAEEHETTSKPVPEKVMDDMRSCDAGIIHVASEQVLIDESGKPQHKINENVLIEIGAAMALYRHNFILLVESGVQLPSNLQGLYECRYEGDKLDGESTMKLLKAFNEFR